MTYEHAYKLRQLIVKASASLSDTDALNGIELFEKWDGNGVAYSEGKRLRYNDILYKVKQEHTSQSDWTPDITASLYEQVAEPGQGTKENPIPYNNNMKLEEGLYYIQFEVEYYCFRSTGTPVYNNLADLVNLYVNIVED